jgi:hypothetical protein
MFSLAEMWGLRPERSNPRKHIRKHPEGKRERFLSVDELRRIGEVLRETEAEGVELPSAILAARLLILTGCRLNEIMSLKWAYVDIAERVLRLPDSKTGAKVVHLGLPAVEYLEAAQRVDGNPWIITDILPGKPLSHLQPFWQHVRARAGVKDVCIHDLRHTFASTAVASGQGLPMIRKLLGHTQVQTTVQYAHLAAEPVRLAADAVTQDLRRSLGSDDVTAPRRPCRTPGGAVRYLNRFSGFHSPADARRGPGLGTADLVHDLRKACVTPHVAQKSRYSAIDGRSTPNECYALSIKHRERIEEAFGWTKTIGGIAQTVDCGVERVRSRFILTIAASYLARLPGLLAPCYQEYMAKARALHPNQPNTQGHSFCRRDTVSARRLFQWPVRGQVRHGSATTYPRSKSSYPRLSFPIVPICGL